MAHFALHRCNGLGIGKYNDAISIHVLYWVNKDVFTLTKFGILTKIVTISIAVHMQVKLLLAFVNWESIYS